MGSLYRLGQKFVDFCNVVQQNQNSEVTVPSSKVLYSETSAIRDALSTKLPSNIVVSSTNVTEIEFTCNSQSGNGTTQYIIFNFVDGTKRQYQFSTSGIGAMYYNGSTWSTLWAK